MPSIWIEGIENFGALPYSHAVRYYLILYSASCGGVFLKCITRIHGVSRF